jgi:hypothetical protein
MSFLDALLGRARAPKPVTDPLFALSTAEVSLRSEAGYAPAGRAGIVFRPAASHQFADAKQELNSLLELAAREMGSRLETNKDNYGYLWLLFTDSDWEDLVSLVHMAGTALTEEGFGEQLLAAVFRLEKEEGGRPLYLIYGYKRGRFYPFIPGPEAAREREEPEEMRIFALLERELPWEEDTSRWYPLWGCPV